MKKHSKIIYYLKIKDYLALWQDKKVVLVGGCFDLLHYGHLKFLKKAKEAGDYLIIALESDQFIKKNKRNLPVHNQQQRAKILSHLDFVDLVILLPYFSSGNEYFEMVKKINPDIIAVTNGDPQIKNKKKQIELIGGQLKVVSPLLKKFSTKKIIKKLENI